MIKSILRLLFALGGVAVMGTATLAQESIFNPPITSDPSVLNQNENPESLQPESNVDVSEERDPRDSPNYNRLSGVEIRISEQAEVRVRNNALNVDSPGIVEFVNRF